MTAIANLPDIRPSLLLDFANSGRVDPRIQCTRASSATCFGPDGKLRTVAANVPRIDYDPATGKCLGLLVEESRTNLIRHSNSFTASAWTKSDVTVQTVADMFANGLQATKLTPGVGIYKTVNQTFNLPDNTAVTASVFAKAGEFNTVRLGVRDKTNVIVSGHFNLATGVASRPEIEAKYVGDGWWRVSLHVASLAAGTAIPLVHIYAINNDTLITPGDGVSGLYISGVQVEVGSFPTSYIPTEGSAVTRATDVVYVNAVSFVNQNEGTLLTEFKVRTLNVTHAQYVSVLRKESGATTEGVGSFIDINTAVISARVRNSSAGDPSSIANYPLTENETCKMCVSYGYSLGRSAFNGSAVSTSSRGVPTLDTLYIGSNATTTPPMNGTIKSITYYPKALPNTVLQEITK